MIIAWIPQNFTKKVKEMKSKALWIVSGLAVVFAGCATNADEEAMIPPSANYAPIQAPVYPPLNQPYSPNLLNDDNSRVMNIDRLNVGEANIPAPAQNPAQNQSQNPSQNPQNPQNPQNGYEPYPSDFPQGYGADYVPGYVAPNEVVPYELPLGDFKAQEAPEVAKVEPKEPNIIPNSPLLAAENTIELSAVGMGVAPENTISPSQALALAKRAAIIDAYRQIGEKMYGIKINAQDTIKDMVLSNSVVKARVEALIKNADIVETIYKDGLCQVTMELKLDSKTWSKILATNG